MALRATTTQTASASVPDAFVDANWSVATGGASALAVTISSLPTDNGATITDIEYDLNASGTWVSSGGTTSFNITSLTASTSYDVRLRAVNSEGAGTAGNTETATSGAASAADYTVTDQSSLNNAMASATSGEVIEFAASAQDGQFSYSTSQTLTGVTMRCASGVTIEKLDLANITGLTLDGMAFEWDNQGGTDFGGSGFAADQAYALVLNTCQGITVSNSTFDMDPTQNGSRQTIATLRKRPGGIRSTSSGGTTQCEITGCTFTRVRDAMVLKSGDWNVNNNHGTQIYEDFCVGDATDWTFDDNTATLFEGSYVRDYTVASTTGLVVGEVYVKGNEVIEIFSVQSGTVIWGQINNYDLPSTGLFTGTGAATGKSFTVTATGLEVTQYNIHGDMFQPLMLSGSTSYRLHARRNIGYRTLAYDTTGVCQEPNSQLILAQRNGGSGKWDPCVITHNISSLGQPIGIHVMHGNNGNLDYNSVLWGQRGIRSDLEFDNLTNMSVQFNVGDNNSGGAVDDDGGNTSTTIANNVFVDGNNGDQATEYAAPYTYPQSKASFAPVASGAIDTGSAGALTTAGEFRP
jgi:hypothetical protein